MKAQNKELEFYLSKSISEKYNKFITMISNLQLLIIFDDWDPIIKNELSEFRKLIEDIAQRVQNSTLLLTSEVAINNFERYNWEIIYLDKLTERNIYDLLIKKSKGRDKILNELLELQNEGCPTQESSKILDLNHNFFKILNGNPLSTILVSSLTQGNNFLVFKII